MSLRIAGGLMMALAGAAFAVTAYAQAPTPPGGAYVILNAEESNQNAITAQALADPGVDGLLIHLRWSEFSTGLETYDWPQLDNAVTMAKKAKKRFEFGIVIGGATPPWVVDPPPGLNAKHGSFVDSAAGKCVSFTMAAPYDPHSLAAFRNLLQQIAHHLHQTGGYDSLGMLKLFGITTTTDELRLPALRRCGSNAIQTWRRLGYTPAKVRAAWNTMLQDYLDFFPDKSFNIGFIPDNAFPGIRDDGTPAATTEEAKALSAELAATLIADAGAAMPGRLALGFDSLTLSVPPGYTAYQVSTAAFLAAAVGAGARLGYQTNELLGEFPKGGASCGGSSPANAVPCTGAKDFASMLRDGLLHVGFPSDLQGVYIEVFPQNVVAFAPAMQTVHSDIAAWTGE